VTQFLGIGGMTIAIRCADERVRCEWKDPVRRFLTGPATPDLELTIDMLETPVASRGELLFEPDAVWRMLRDRDELIIECRTELFGEQPYKVGTFDEAFTRGTILMREDVADANPLEYPLDEVIVANLLGRGRGVELHSCGVVDRKGRGHLFVGVSGAGKTTTARLWENEAAAIVSDDRVIVRDVDGELRMFGTPWHGEAELSVATSAPLAGVYLLVQSEKNALLPLSHAAAIAKLFRCTFPLFHDARALDFTLEFLSRIVARVPVRELYFTRDQSAIELVLREAA
jgi:hypothetical protein